MNMEKWENRRISMEFGGNAGILGGFGEIVHECIVLVM